MIIYKNDPKYKVSYTSKNHTYITVGTDKISKNKNNTKSHFLEILINQVKTGIKSVYDKGYSGNLR